MTSTLLAVLTVAAICLCIGLAASLILISDSHRKLQRSLGEALALQRMVTIHGDAQLSTDGRLDVIDQQLEKLQTRNLKVQSFISGLSSIENASSILDEYGTIDIERLAIQSGLTEREANLMLKLRTSYSTDITSPPAGAK